MSDVRLVIDGDFHTGAECQYHCTPTIHPGQTSLPLKQACVHKAWPQNSDGDFPPFVKCKGRFSKCEIPQKFLSRAISGKKRRLGNLQEKIEKTKRDIAELQMLNERKDGRS